ncbi:MAG TPA: hypothetical protein VGO14_01940 [Solirubrobacteraceae bacterium]|jgi:hypothetical protein|nr:hypothetical protein [Solirubrobacteraceae bacterium]
MPHDHPTTDLPPVRATTTVDEPAERPHVEDEERDWAEEPQDLPARPRRRLLTPATGGLLVALLVAGGFLVGVVVEKDQASSTSAAGGTGTAAAARFGRAGGAGGGAGPAAGGALAGAGGGGATVGQVAFIQGTTLYVRDTQGNTVKVMTSPGSTVTKSVKASTKSIHPGETVVVTGATGSGGVVNAEAIRVGGEAGGLPASPSGSSGAKTGGGEPALFGSGG